MEIGCGKTFIVYSNRGPAGTSCMEFYLVCCYDIFVLRASRGFIECSVQQRGEPVEEFQVHGDLCMCSAYMRVEFSL